MRASYGYSDASGDYFITVDTDRCDGCGECVEACPAGILEVGEDENDPLRDEPVASVRPGSRRSLASACSACKPTRARPVLACVVSCVPGAITHSW
jgi:ferredoxin